MFALAEASGVMGLEVAPYTVFDSKKLPVSDVCGPIQFPAADQIHEGAFPSFVSKTTFAAESVPGATPAEPPKLRSVFEREIVHAELTTTFPVTLLADCEASADAKIPERRTIITAAEESTADMPNKILFHDFNILSPFILKMKYL